MNYNEYFSRGFYFSEKKRESEVFQSWATLYIGGYIFQFHPKTDFYVTQSSSGDESVLIIGLPVDLEDINAGAHKIATKASIILENDGFEKFQRYVAYLGGRFLAVVIRKSEGVIVIPDCHATYACYYTEKNGGAFSSHINLLARIEDLNVNEVARGIVNSPMYQAPGGKYYPALLLPYEKVFILFPNCRLESKFGSSTIINKRFYPFTDLELSNYSKNEIIVKFNEQLSLHIKGIVKDREFYVSLTGGGDSGVTFSSLIKSGLSKQAKAFTYFNASKPTELAISDLVAASSRAFTYDIPHKIVHLKPLEMSSSFHGMYRQTFKYGARYPSLARAYFEELPHDILSLVSTCSETGTVFYQNRNITKITAESLAEKFSNSGIRMNKEVIQSFDDYIDYSFFSKDKLGPLDFYDVFYWEHRNAKWASLWYSEADLAHFTVVPFNQRGIIELMLSLSFEDRLAKEILNSSLIQFKQKR